MQKKHFPFEWRVLLLTILVAIQLILVIRGFFVPWLSRVWRLRDQTKVERSASLGQGQGFADYISFLQEEIPEEQDIVVISPPHSFGGVFSYIHYIQYFLYPRFTSNCTDPVEDCLQKITGDHIYIISVPGFPPDGYQFEAYRYVGFEDGYGLYQPR
jgi:hypothetical protein